MPVTAQLHKPKHKPHSETDNPRRNPRRERKEENIISPYLIINHILNSPEKPLDFRRTNCNPEPIGSFSSTENSETEPCKVELLMKITCSHCKKTQYISPIRVMKSIIESKKINSQMAGMAAKIFHRVPSPARTAASKLNGCKGGRPRKNPDALAVTSTSDPAANAGK